MIRGWLKLAVPAGTFVVGILTLGAIAWGGKKGSAWAFDLCSDSVEDAVQIGREQKNRDK